MTKRKVHWAHFVRTRQGRCVYADNGDTTFDRAAVNCCQCSKLLSEETEKKCSACGKVRPVKAFNKRHDTGEPQGQCRECQNNKTRERYKRNLEMYRGHSRKFHGANKDKANARRKVARAKNREAVNARQRARRDKTKEDAHYAVVAAIKSGTIERPGECSLCNIACYPDAHHGDYSRPLEIEWLCKSCHMKLHFSGKQYREREADET